MTQESLSLKKHKLEDVLQKLEQYKILSQEEFFADTKAQDATMLNLVIGIEAITDIGNAILAKKFQEYPNTYRDIILKLGEHGVIPQDFAQANATMADFRNHLIHIYEDVDMKKVYSYLQEAPDIFRKFMQYLSRSLG